MLEETQLTFKELGDEIKKYLHIIHRRRWMIVVVTILCLCGTFVFYKSKPPIYKAEALLVMDLDADETMNLGQRRYPTRWSGELLQTQMEVVRSQRVVGETVRLLGLHKESDSEERIRRFRQRISVKAVRTTRAFKIGVQHHNPKEAVRQANILVDCYLNFNLDNRREASSNAFLSLSEQLQVMKQKVAESENALLKYKVDEHIVSLEKRRMQLEQDVETKSVALAKVDNDIKSLEATLQGIKSTQYGGTVVALPGHLQHAVIDKIQQELNQALVDYADASDHFKGKHPRMMALESRITSLRGQLNREINKVVVSLETDRNIKRVEAASLSESLKELKRMSMVVSKQAVQHGVLAREAESNQKLYNTLLDRLKQANVEGNTRANNVRVIDHARMPLEAMGSGTKTILTIGLMFSLILGTAGCFILEIFDDTLISSTDVHYYFNQQPFATIPYVKAKNPRSNNAFVLAFRAFRVLLEKQRRHGLCTVMITSSVDGEGKTTTVQHLGETLSQWGLNVLMVDADLINPSLSRHYHLQKQPGLTDHLYYERPFEELIVAPGPKNLSFLPAGLDVGRPIELLGSNALGQLLIEAKKTYDIVLVDSPPVNEVPEVPVLGAQVDGVLMVARCEKTPRRKITEARRSLESFHVNLMGIVLTGVRGPKYLPKSPYTTASLVEAET